MINNIVLTGMVIELPKMREKQTETEYADILLEVVRPFKNEYGIYDSDKISIALGECYTKKANDICRIGDMLGVQGRIKSCDEDGSITYEIVAEHVSFTSI